MGMAKSYERPPKQDGSSRWVVRYRNPKTGKWTERYAGRTKREAEALRIRIESDIAAGVYGEPKGEDTFSDLCEEYMEAKEKAVKVGTYLTIKAWLNNHAIPAMGDKPLSDIKPYDIQTFVNSLSKSGLSPGTVRQIYATVRAVFRKGVEWEKTTHNPCRGIELPRQNDYELEFLKPAEIKKLLSAAEEPYHTLFAILALGGLRISEALGLRWECIDLKANVIKVDKSYTHADGLSSPKTAAGRRGVPMMPTLAVILREYHKGSETDFLFPNKYGYPISHSTPRRALTSTLKRAGLKEVNLHSLRHSFASILLDSGASIVALQRVLGHASASETLDTYAHLIPESLGNAIIKADEEVFG